MSAAKTPKNPLYVVKGQQVEEAQNWLDMMVKKFNLAPVLEMLQRLIEMMASQVTNYPMMMALKARLDELMNWLAPVLWQIQKLSASLGQ